MVNDLLLQKAQRPQTQQQVTRRFRLKGSYLRRSFGSGQQISFFRQCVEKITKINDANAAMNLPLVTDFELQNAVVSENPQNTTYLNIRAAFTLTLENGDRVPLEATAIYDRVRKSFVSLQTH